MLGLILVPLFGVAWLSVHERFVKTELVEVKTETPLFAGMTRTVTRKVPQAVRDASGNPVVVDNYVGGKNFSLVAEPARLWSAITHAVSLDGIYRDITTIEFWGALEFTMLYIVVTTPLVLLLGFCVALGVNSVGKLLKGPLIFASLLPFIITPIVGALSVYWLFLDNAVVNALLQQAGFQKLYFLASGFSIRAIIIGYGVWSTTPFAFVILYAGLQTVPGETLEAARVDGATRWERLRYVIVPHLLPLFVFITLIHLMDAYRVFEPVLVFGSNLYANSMQYMIYRLINVEDNFNKAAAAALLTVIGIVLLLLPLLRQTWREQREAA
jgi:multiple sugar transport system permease protein